MHSDVKKLARLGVKSSQYLLKRSNVHARNYFEDLSRLCSSLEGGLYKMKKAITEGFAPIFLRHT